MSDICVMRYPSKASGKSSNSRLYFSTLKLYFPLYIPYNKAPKGIAANPSASALKNRLRCGNENSRDVADSFSYPPEKNLKISSEKRKMMVIDLNVSIVNKKPKA